MFLAFILHQSIHKEMINWGRVHSVFEEYARVILETDVSPHQDDADFEIFIFKQSSAIFCVKQKQCGYACLT